MNTDPGILAMEALHREAERLNFSQTLGGFVHLRAKEHGDKVVARWFQEDKALTYRELDERAQILASALQQHGIRKGAHVAVMLPNCPEFLISWVAIAHLGAVMVPVNTAYTGEELYYVLNDSNAQALMVDENYLPSVSDMPEPLALLDRHRIFVRGSAPAGHVAFDTLLEEGTLPFESPQPVAPTDLLQIQYTSGTTGFPKGCMQPHEYWIMLGLLAALQRGEKLAVRNVLIWSPFFYMDPMWQFLMTMQLGGTAFIAARMSLSKFMDWLVDYEIHYCTFPEPALKVHPPSDKDRDIKLKFISAFGWRGEANREVEERFELVARNSYGMTEIGGGISLPAGATHMVDQETCGLPAIRREVRIVDEQGQDVPRGEIGELWVAGRGIFWGYYNRPRANAESFTGKWFHTGDLFRRDENGYYYIVGRIKEMIKRAGENISARELEAAIRGLDEVEEVAAVPVPDPLRREEVKVYLKLRSGLTKENCPPEKVIAHCEKRLAAFKIPRYYTYTDEFPRTPSNKIAKTRIIAETEDLRFDSYDRVENIWR
jgi:long-chain acyl-CoA synthetase/crotonobetaine/carnitine-CoA ligase